MEEVTGSSPVEPTSNYCKDVIIDSNTLSLVGRPVAAAIKKRLKTDIANLEVKPKLAIIHISPDASADIYVHLKQRFGADIDASVEILRPPAGQLEATIARLNDDATVHGIIIQLPLPDALPTQTLLASVEASKDVDGLAPNSPFITAGARGIMELLAAYGVKLSDARVALVGTGALFGGPLRPCLEKTGAQLEVFDLKRPIDREIIRSCKIIIGATGEVGIITDKLVSPGAVVVDATGVDVAPEVRQRRDIRITPASGGVGPMTVAALFENLVEAAQAK